MLDNAINRLKHTLNSDFIIDSFNKKDNKWIKCVDNKPISLIDVIFKDNKGNIYLGYYNCYRNWIDLKTDKIIENVTMWSEKE